MARDVGTHNFSKIGGIMVVQRKLLLLFILVFSFFTSSLYAAGIFDKEEESAVEPPPALQELFDAMGEDIPAIAISLPEIGPGVDASLAGEIIDGLTEDFIRNSLFRPFSIQQWLDTVYDKRAQNVVDLVKRLAYEEFPLDWVMTSSFRNVRGENLVRLGFYNLKAPTAPIYFFRSFTDLSQWWEALPVLKQEMALRFDSPASPCFTSSVYVEAVPVKLFLYSELSTGEFEFIPVSLLHMGDFDFREDEDFLKDIITYEFHSSQLLGVVADDLIPYHREAGASPCEYTIRGELRISEEVQLLVLSLYRNRSRRASRIFEYQVPLEGISLSSLRLGVRQLANMVYEQLLSEKELQLVSFQDLDFHAYGSELFYNNFYIGDPIQPRFCLPAGCQWFSLLRRDEEGTLIPAPIDEASVAVFTSPVEEACRLYPPVRARHIQYLLSAEEGER